MRRIFFNESQRQSNLHNYLCNQIGIERGSRTEKVIRAVNNILEGER